LKHAFSVGLKAAGDGGKECGKKNGAANGGEDAERAEDAECAEGDKELAATARGVDETLAMARWKAETALKALRPVREAAAAVAAAAKRTAAVLVPNPGELPDWLIDGWGVSLAYNRPLTLYVLNSAVLSLTTTEATTL
jgi:hypothetical protein